MPIECPECGRLNSETTRRCDCGHDLSAIDAHDDMAPNPERRRSSKGPLPRGCPLCQSDNVRIDGWASMQTRVQFGSRWTGPGNTGYGLNCFACLDCGNVGFYLGEGDVESLRSRPLKSNEPVQSRSTGCGARSILLIALGLGVFIAVGRLLIF